jgi:hypothetical protein
LHTIGETPEKVPRSGGTLRRRPVRFRRRPAHGVRAPGGLRGASEDRGGRSWKLVERTGKVMKRSDASANMTMNCGRRRGNPGHRLMKFIGRSRAFMRRRMKVGNRRRDAGKRIMLFPGRRWRWHRRRRTFPGRFMSFRRRRPDVHERGLGRASSQSYSQDGMSLILVPGRTMAGPCRSPTASSRDSPTEDPPARDNFEGHSTSDL